MNFQEKARELLKDVWPHGDWARYEEIVSRIAAALEAVDAEAEERGFQRGRRAGIAAEWKEIHSWRPKLHYCADWDFLLIDQGDDEFKYCHCFDDRSLAAREET